jgi:GNAT superfamily N-acetyltransferase
LKNSDDDCCVLRDLQIIDSAKNKGIGRASVNEAKRRALNAKLTTLTLRVFKISPAVALYKEMALLYKVKMNAFSIW